MSKAEERALEAFPDYKIIDGRYVTQKNERSAYKAGYHQAEKDLELTWKDIELIVNIDKDTDNEEAIIGIRNNEEHYEEVLKRFNKLKEKQL